MPRLSFLPLTADRFRDFETLFGPRGACAGCWCMFFRLRRSAWTKGQGAGNRKAMKAVVTAGRTPGILAYEDGQPVGWCAVAPRSETPALERSRILKPVDDRPVWSVTCFFVRKGLRRRGLTRRLLEAAAVHARKNGAGILEGYPVEPKSSAIPDAFAWTGLASAFLEAGFAEVVRRSPTRPIMRRRLSPPRG